MTHESKYYLAESPALVNRCRELRANYIAQGAKFWAYAESLGATHYQCGFDGRLIGLVFPWGKHPDGFLKPKCVGAATYPMRGKKGAKWREEFKALDAHLNAAEFIQDLVTAPTNINYEFPGGSGSRGIGAFPDAIQVCFYDDCNFLIVLPDVAAAIRSLLVEKPEAKITNGADLWRVPDGMREILREEWDLMVARHRRIEGSEA